MSIPKIASYPLPADFPAGRVSWRFDAARAALLVHDLQDYFLDFYDRDATPVTDMLANVRRLVDMARAAGMPVYYTAQLARQTPAERGLLTDMWGPGLTAQPDREAICAIVAPLSGDRVLDKWRYSAFQRSELETELRTLGRDQLVICGIYAHIGCLMTACEAFMKDIQPFFVADALADFSAQQHAMALDYVARCCGKVVRTQELVGTAATPARPASLAALCAWLAHELQVDPAQLRPEDNLMDWGLDSVRIMAFVARWRRLGADLNFVQLAQEPTPAAWWRLLEGAATQPA